MILLLTQTDAPCVKKSLGQNLIFGNTWMIMKMSLDGDAKIVRKKITTYEELTDHVCNTNMQQRFNVENSFSFLTRNMRDASHIDSTIGQFEIPLLESTSELDVNCTSEVSENQEDNTTINSRKRKLSNEPLKVSFIGRLCK